MDGKKELEILFRSAALKTLRDAGSGLNGLYEISSPVKFGDELSQLILNNGLDGLENNSLYPMSQNEFINEINNLGYPKALHKIKNAAKAAAKLAAGTVKTVAKTTYKYSGSKFIVDKTVAGTKAAAGLAWDGITKIAPLAAKVGMFAASQYLGLPMGGQQQYQQQYYNPPRNNNNLLIGLGAGAVVLALLI